MWLSWVIFALKDSAPGLLDDGAHIAGAAPYAEKGLLKEIANSFDSYTKGQVRFYQTHFTLVGVYHILFDQNLRLWYLGNITLAVLSALAVGYVVFTFSNNILAALLGALLLLTSSPAAETLRGNFGKAEAIMAACLLAGIALWAYAGKSKYPKSCIIGAGILFALGCVSKESGKLVGLAMCLPLMISWIPAKHKDLILEHKVSFLKSLSIIGILGIVASWLVSLPSKNIEWMKGYYHLKFGFNRIEKMAQFYATECPDFLILLGFFTLVYALLLWIHRMRDERVILGAAFLTVSWAYFLCLLFFSQRTAYYVFIPVGFLALSAGLGISLIAKSQRWLLISAFSIFFLTRIYSIPYLFLSTKAQQLFDNVNYEAMLYSKSISAAAVYAVDINEEWQFIQEWNLLSHNFHAAADVPMLYGAEGGFRMSRLQDRLRNDPRFQEDGYYDETKDGKPRGWRLQIPKPGEYLSTRFGEIIIGKHTIRATMPFKQNAKDLISLFDKDSLEIAGAVSKSESILDPTNFKISKATYGWSFYKVVKPMGYLVQECTLKKWMTKSTALIIPEQSPYSRISIKMNIPPQGHSFPIKLWAESNQSEISAIQVDSPGDFEFVIPVSQGQIINLHSSSWFKPQKTLGADAKEVSVQLIEINAE